MSKKISARPYGKIEIIEEVHPKQANNPGQVLIKPRAVLINGQEILVTQDGISIDTAANDYEQVTRVTIEFMPDDVHIRRVPAGYINRANHLYTLEKDSHRTADIGIAGKIKRLFRR